MLSKKEAMKIDSLHIKVTPLIEDAFYAYREIDDAELEKRLSELPADYVSGDKETDDLLEKYINACEASNRALRRWYLHPDEKERMEAMNQAFKMIENQKKYGFPCYDWIPD